MSAELEQVAALMKGMTIPELGEIIALSVVLANKQDGEDELVGYMMEKYKYHIGDIQCGPGDGAPVEVSQYHVLVTGYDLAHKIRFIKVIREIFQLGLMEAKLKSEEPLPIRLTKEPVYDWQAEKIMKALQECGSLMSHTEKVSNTGRD